MKYVFLMVCCLYGGLLYGQEVDMSLNRERTTKTFDERLLTFALEKNMDFEQTAEWLTEKVNKTGILPYVVKYEKQDIMSLYDKKLVLFPEVEDAIKFEE